MAPLVGDVVVDEVHLLRRGALREDAFAGPEEERVDHRAYLVDQFARQESLYQRGAAEHVEVTWRW
jgi:uncharacterized protein (DUF934 family)